MTENKNGANASNATNPTDSEDNQFLQQFLYHLARIWTNIKVTRNEILHRIGAYALYDRIANFSHKHPYLALIIAVCIVSFILPFIIIVVFALSTVILTFSGFVLFEGTLIAFTSIVLFGCLGAVLFASLFFGGVSIAGYMGFLHFAETCKNFTKKKAISKERQSENVS